MYEVIIISTVVLNTLVKYDSSFFDTKTDNKGRQLTQEQQEYFKDSKARNER